MGVIAPIDDTDWSTPPPGEAPPVGWLPHHVQDAPPPLGPSTDALPLAEDPITMALIWSALPGGSPPSPNLVSDAVLTGVEHLPLPATHPMLALLPR